MSARDTLRAIPWSENFRQMFRLAADDWRPPATVTSVVNAARTRLTMKGRFTRPDGQVMQLTSRMVREGETWFVDEEELDLRMTFRPEAVRA